MKWPFGELNKLMEENREETLVPNLKFLPSKEINKMKIKNYTKKKRFQGKKREKETNGKNSDKEKYRAKLFHNKWDDICRKKEDKNHGLFHNKWDKYYQEKLIEMLRKTLETWKSQKS